MALAICLHLHITETETVSLVGLCVGLVFALALLSLILAAGLVLVGATTSIGAS